MRRQTGRSVIGDTRPSWC